MRNNKTKKWNEIKGINNGEKKHVKQTELIKIITFYIAVIPFLNCNTICDLITQKIYLIVSVWHTRKTYWFNGRRSSLNFLFRFEWRVLVIYCLSAFELSQIETANRLKVWRVTATTNTWMHVNLDRHSQITWSMFNWLPIECNFNKIDFTLMRVRCVSSKIFRFSFIYLVHLHQCTCTSHIWIFVLSMLLFRNMLKLIRIFFASCSFACLCTMESLFFFNKRNELIIGGSRDIVQSEKKRKRIKFVSFFLMCNNFELLLRPISPRRS